LISDSIESEASRGLLITFTTYSKRLDWWSSNVILFEFGVNEIVYRSTVRSYAFRPNIYESDQERNYKVFDLVRLVLAFFVLGLFIFLNVSMSILKVRPY